MFDRQAAASQPPQVCLDQIPAAIDAKPEGGEVDPGALKEAASPQCSLTPFGRVLCRPERAVPFISVPATPMEVFDRSCPELTLLAVWKRLGILPPDCAPKAECMRAALPQMFPDRYPGVQESTQPWQKFLLACRTVWTRLPLTRL